MTVATIRARLKRVRSLVVLARFVRSMTTSLGRGRILAQARGSRLFQPATVTRMDRHPDLFELVATRLARHEAPRLLSFGCSTGEEAFTLSSYLPHSLIDAIDANPACISQARRSAESLLAEGRLHASRIRFVCADIPNALASDGYDAVLCMSVLRHGDLEARTPEICTATLPFPRFAAAIDSLDRCLRPGGLLVLWGCSFRFADTPTAKRYRTVPSPNVRAQPGPFYGADDRLLADAAYGDFVFFKLE